MRQRTDCERPRHITAMQGPESPVASLAAPRGYHPSLKGDGLSTVTPERIGLGPHERTVRSPDAARMTVAAQSPPSAGGLLGYDGFVVCSQASHDGVEQAQAGRSKVVARVNTGADITESRRWSPATGSLTSAAAPLPTIHLWMPGFLTMSCWSIRHCRRSGLPRRLCWSACRPGASERRQAAPRTMSPGFPTW